MKSLALTALAFASLSASAIEIAPDCKKELINQMTEKEVKYLDSIDQQISSPEVQIWANEKTNGDVSIGGWIEDTTDGRSVRYGSGVISKKDFNSCTIDLKRVKSSECRYSTDGDDELVDKLGWKVIHEATLKPTTKLAKYEKEQLLSWLGEGRTLKEDAIPQLIQDTDDGEILKQVLQLPSGVRLDYYKAYGGDNPFGIFFLSHTDIPAGSNGDSDICIGYNVEK